MNSSLARMYALCKSQAPPLESRNGRIKGSYYIANSVKPKANGNAHRRSGEVHIRPTSPDWGARSNSAATCVAHDAGIRFLSFDERQEVPLAGAATSPRSRGGLKNCGSAESLSSTAAAGMNDRLCAGFWTPAMTGGSSHSGGWRPKSAKARSRGTCGTRQGGVRYEDCMSAPLSMVSAMPARDDVHACMPRNRRECSRHLGGHAECINGRLVD
jgi:hypothetical protein